MTTVKIGGAVEHDQCASEIVLVKRDGSVGVSDYHFPFDVVFAGVGDGGEEGGVVFDVGGDDFFDEATTDLVEDEIDTVGGVEGEGDEVVAGLEFKEFEDFAAGGGDFVVGDATPLVFDALAAGIVSGVIGVESVKDGLGAEGLAGGIEVNIVF